MGQEKTPLTAPVLYPTRTDSDIVQLVEKVCFAAFLLLAVATAGYCIIEGIRLHPQTLVLGVTVVVTTILFVLVARLYRNDVLQDRKVVYLTGALLVLVCSASLMVTTAWVPGQFDPYYGCPDTSFFSLGKKGPSADMYGGGTCMTWAAPVAAGSKSVVVSGMTTNLWTVGSFPLPSLNISGVTCVQSQSVVATVYGVSRAAVNYTCPKQLNRRRLIVPKLH